MENVARNIKKRRKFLPVIFNALCSNGFSVDAVAGQTASGILPRRIEHCNVVSNQIVSEMEGEKVLTGSYLLIMNNFASLCTIISRLP